MTKTNRIKIFQITHDLNIGGLQRLVVDISKSLDKSKYEVTVCALREGGPLESELMEDGIPVIKLAPGGNGTDYLTFWKLYRIFRKIKPHVIHTHNTQPFVEGGLAARMAGVPVHVHTEHGRQFPDIKRYMLAERVMSHFADTIVAVSESAKNDLVTHEKISPEKITVVINGIDGDKFSRTVDREKKLRELGIDRAYRPVLGFAGRLSPEKGLVHLISAMERLVQEFPDVVLLIAGEGSLSYDLIAETEKRGLEHNIRFLGPRSDMNEIMAVLDVFVLPSLREGLPLVLLEAAAAGLAIVATDVGGNRTVVNEGLNGHLVKAGDGMPLYHALSDLAGDGGKRKKFGDASKRIYEENFSMKKMMDSYLHIYHDRLSVKSKMRTLQHATPADRIGMRN